MRLIEYFIKVFKGLVMTMLAEKVIYFNRKLIIPVALTSPICLIVVGYGYKRFLVEQSSFKLDLFLAIFVAICLVFFYRDLKMILAKTPALILTHEGITDHLRMLNLKKGATTRFTPWSEIESIKYGSLSSTEHILIRLNHTGFINKLFKGTVRIPVFMVDTKQDMLLEMLKMYHEESKKNGKKIY